jgi:hypothetical protein
MKKTRHEKRKAITADKKTRGNQFQTEDIYNKTRQQRNNYKAAIRWQSYNKTRSDQSIKKD